MANYQSYKKIQGNQALIAGSVTSNEVVGLSTAVAHQFYVYHSDFYSATGGCCLLWTVPANTRSVRFELTGSGGSGSPGLCCGSGPAGGSGSYAVRTVFSHCGHFTPGSSRYTICSGGSSCSCCGYSTGFNCCGAKGCTTFVTPYDGGAGGMSNFCAQGGSWGHHRCSQNCYACSHMRQCSGPCIITTSCANCVDNRDRSFGIRGVNGMRINTSYCRNDHRAIAGSAVGPWATWGGMMDDNCSAGNNHGCCRGHALFPGGGGSSAHTDGSCCWGGFGGSGLVVVSYWQ